MAEKKNGDLVLAGTGHTGPDSDAWIGQINDSPGMTFEMLSVITATPTSSDQFFDVAVQHDGKIVAVGSSNGGSGNRALVVRLNEDGSRDQTFGQDGIVIHQIHGKTTEARALVFQPDDKIVVAGAAEMDGASAFAVTRFYHNGVPDSSFGDQGSVVISFGPGGDSARDVVVQDDGRIIVVGSVTVDDFNTAFGVVRLNPDGSLDATFGMPMDGTATFDLSPGHDNANAVVIPPNPKDTVYVIGAQNDFSASADMAVLRLNASSQPQALFMPFITSP